jgi:transcriptional regulator with XRE-family HTH domain
MAGAAEEQPETTEEPHVGDRVRRLRRENGLSGRELADLAGLTPAYLSRVENGRISPTVATLGRIVAAMGETFVHLFEDDDPDIHVIRAHDRTSVRSHGVVDFRITPAWASHLSALDSRVDAGQASGDTAHTHPGDEETAFVLDGALVLWVDGAEHRLETGDSLTYPPSLPHRWWNPGPGPSRVLWMMTPAAY